MKKLKIPIKVSGTVIPGEKLGAKIGFPTANLDISKQTLTINQGVYAAACTHKRKKYLSLAYYGPRYISHHQIPSFEAHLLNFNQQIYGQPLTVQLTHYLRPPQKVTSLKKLKVLLKKDFLHFTNNQVVLVTPQDQPISIEAKATAHQDQGQLHRAISVYLFNFKKQLLIQKRSRHKMLWPLTWANTCCSHPQPGEDCLAAAQRRLQQEFGLKAKLKFHHQFIYQAKYKNIGLEHELDFVFTGISDAQPQPNSQEIADWQYLSLPNIKKAIQNQPDKYTPWFKLTLKKLKPSDIFKA